MPREYEQYRLQLIIEYNRVLAWGKAAGLIDVPRGSTLGATLGAEGIELVAIVARIQWLLSEFRDLNARYGNELPQSGKEGDNKTDLHEQPTNVDVLKGISSLAISYEAKKKERRHLRGTNRIREMLGKTGRITKDIITHPVRVRWIAMDKEAFEALLKNLHVLTERLHELMRNHREKQIDDITAKTYREMILTRNKVQELQDMFMAVTSLVSRSAGIRREHNAHLNDRTLQDLVRLKIINRASDYLRLSRPSTSDLARSLVTAHRFSDSELSERFEWNEKQVGAPELLPRPRGILSTDKGKIPVWIEWKFLGDIPPNSPEDQTSAVRTAALAEMLRLPKPASLHAPDCVGFFDDRGVSGASRYGWIFKMPEGSDNNTRVGSLHDILGDERYKPSLSQRVVMASKLCSTVLSLHAVNWLHKGLFSDNVIFHFTGEDDGTGGGLSYDPEKPVLSGFEFSRPDGTPTTVRDMDNFWDMYRWPSIQREMPTERNSTKTYDVYSLGLVLLEIAHWEKLHKLMHLGREETVDDPKVPGVPLEESAMVRDWLLGIKDGAPFEAAGRPNPLKELRNTAGDRYWKAVERCVWAHGVKGFGVEELEDQSNDSTVGIALQEAFTTYVVEELRSVHI